MVSLKTNIMHNKIKNTHEYKKEKKTTKRKGISTVPEAETRLGALDYLPSNQERKFQLFFVRASAMYAQKINNLL